jgi:hypothetical protein
MIGFLIYIHENDIINNIKNNINININIKNDIIELDPFITLYCIVCAIYNIKKTNNIINKNFNIYFSDNNKYLKAIDYINKIILLNKFYKLKIYYINHENIDKIIYKDEIIEIINDKNIQITEINDNFINISSNQKIIKMYNFNKLQINIFIQQFIDIFKSIIDKDNKKNNIITDYIDYYKKMNKNMDNKIILDTIKFIICNSYNKYKLINTDTYKPINNIEDLYDIIRFTNKLNEKSSDGDIKTYILNNMNNNNEKKGHWIWWGLPQFYHERRDLEGFNFNITNNEIKLYLLDKYLYDYYLEAITKLSEKKNIKVSKKVFDILNNLDLTNNIYLGKDYKIPDNKININGTYEIEIEKFFVFFPPQDKPQDINNIYLFYKNSLELLDQITNVEYKNKIQKIINLLKPIFIKFNAIFKN